MSLPASKRPSREHREDLECGSSRRKAKSGVLSQFLKIDDTYARRLLIKVFKTFGIHIFHYVFTNSVRINFGFLLNLTSMVTTYRRICGFLHTDSFGLTRKPSLPVLGILGITLHIFDHMLQVIPRFLHATMAPIVKTLNVCFAVPTFP